MLRCYPFVVQEFGSLQELARRDTADDAERGTLPEDGTWEHRYAAGL